MVTYNNKDLIDSVKRVSEFIRKNKKNPLTVRVNKDTLPLSAYLKLPALVDAKNRVDKWRKEHDNDYPNYVTIPPCVGFQLGVNEYKILWNYKNNTTTNNNGRYTSTPYLLTPEWLKQDYDTDCALNSLQQSFYKLTGIKVPEKTMMNLGYTSRNGTSHDGINAIIKWFNRNYNRNLTVTWKNLKDYGKTSNERWTNIGKQMSSSNCAIFAHIGYVNGGTNCNSNSNWHGHYEVFDIVNVKTGYIRALNSLSGGYLQNRKISVQECMMSKISQPSLCVIQKK